MCLIYDYETTKKFAASIKRRGGSIICYKRLRLVDGVLHSLCHNHKWHKGFNQSNRQDGVALSRLERGTCRISHGIHVYVKKPPRWCDFDEVIVPIKCSLRDFVGANHHATFQARYWCPSKFDDNENEAVFMKVFLKAADYNAAVDTNPL